MKIKVELELDTDNDNDYTIIEQLAEILEQLRQKYEDN